MGNQCETLIPSRPKYMTLLSHQANNSQFKSIIGFNTFIYNDIMDYLWVDIAYLFMVKKAGTVLSAKLAKIRDLCLFDEDYVIYRFLSLGWASIDTWRIDLRLHQER